MPWYVVCTLVWHLMQFFESFSLQFSFRKPIHFMLHSLAWIASWPYFCHIFPHFSSIKPNFSTYMNLTYGPSHQYKMVSCCSILDMSKDYGILAKNSSWNHIMTLSHIHSGYTRSKQPVQAPNWVYWCCLATPKRPWMQMQCSSFTCTSAIRAYCQIILLW